MPRPKESVTKRRLQVVALRKTGATNSQIAIPLGIPASIVSTDIYVARGAGLLQNAKCGSPFRAGLHLLRSSGRKYSSMGRLMDTLDALTREEVFWLITTLPKGLTMAEHIASILRDAYAEENE